MAVVVDMLYSYPEASVESYYTNLIQSLATMRGKVETLLREAEYLRTRCMHSDKTTLDALIENYKRDLSFYDESTADAQKQKEQYSHLTFKHWSELQAKKLQSITEDVELF